MLADKILQTGIGRPAIQLQPRLSQRCLLIVPQREQAIISQSWANSTLATNFLHNMPRFVKRFEQLGRKEGPYLLDLESKEPYTFDDKAGIEAREMLP